MAAINADLDTYVRRDGKCRVRITVFRDGLLKRYALPIHVKPGHWDRTHKRVKAGDPMQGTYNRAIAAALQRAETIALDNPHLSSEGIVLAMDRKEVRGTKLSEAISVAFEARKERFSPYTVHHIAYLLKEVAAALPDTTLESFGEADAHLYRAWISSKGVGQNTLRGRVKMLRTMYNHACSHYRVPKKDVFEGSIPRKVDVFIECPTFEEFERFERTVPPPALQLTKDAFRLSFYLAGMRAGDLCGLESKSITEQGMAMRQKKSKSVVYAEIGDSAREIIERYKGGEYVLPLAKSQTMSGIGEAVRRLNRELKLLAALCGITTRLTMHSARHLAATKLESNGVDIRTIQQLLGHSTLQQTVDYLAQRKGKEAGKALKGMG